MLPDEVKCAQFFYMDRFLCTVVGGRMLLYELKLAAEGGDDLERLRKRHRFREGLSRSPLTPWRAVERAPLASSACSKPRAMVRPNMLRSNIAPRKILERVTRCARAGGGAMRQS